MFGNILHIMLTGIKCNEGVNLGDRGWQEEEKEARRGLYLGSSKEGWRAQQRLNSTGFTPRHPGGGLPDPCVDDSNSVQTEN